MSSMISSIVVELLLRHAIPLLLHLRVASVAWCCKVRLFRIWADGWSWRLPCLTLAWLGETACAVALRLVCERATRGFGSMLGVEVLELIVPARSLLAADIDV